jgi:hypothetical protein
MLSALTLPCCRFEKCPKFFRRLVFPSSGDFVDIFSSPHRGAPLVPVLFGEKFHVCPWTNVFLSIHFWHQISLLFLILKGNYQQQQLGYANGMGKQREIKLRRANAENFVALAFTFSGHQCSSQTSLAIYFHANASSTPRSRPLSFGGSSR